jgi:hypothetical protein
MKITQQNEIKVFLLVMFLTILLTRIGVFFYNPNPLVFGYELHHFHYGLIILIISDIFLLFNNKHREVKLFFSAIGIALVLDEFLFILGNMNHAQYSSTITSALVLCIIFSALALSTKKLSKE